MNPFNQIKCNNYSSLDLSFCSCGGHTHNLNLIFLPFGGTVKIFSPPLGTKDTPKGREALRIDSRAIWDLTNSDMHTEDGRRYKSTISKKVHFSDQNIKPRVIARSCARSHVRSCMCSRTCSCARSYYYIIIYNYTRLLDNTSLLYIARNTTYLFSYFIY